MMRRPASWGWAALAVGAVLLAAGLVVQPGALPHAWLSMAVLVCSLGIGSMLLLLAHALTGGRWGVAIAPGLYAGVAAAWFVPLVLLPVVLMLPLLYPWARPAGASLPNHAWLNLPFFGVRLAVYLVCWLGAALLVRRGAARRWAPAGLIVLALSWTFGAIDLILSLDPHFTSSAFGMISLAGAGVLALALAILLSPGAGPAVNADLGKLLLGLAVLWAYLDFMQLLIVWQSDLVDQVPWYRVRAFGPAGVVAGAVVMTHTVIPFFALLAPRVRRSGPALRCVAGLMVGSEVLRSWWLVLPAADRRFGLLDAGCMLAVAGLAALLLLRETRRAVAHAHAHAHAQAHANA